MALFRWPEDGGRLDFELLRESPVALYHSRQVLAEHVGWLCEHRYRVHQFDCSAWNGEEDFHTAVAGPLGFPDYYGRNLNAFKDCLCMVDIPEDGGTVLAFSAFDRWFATAPEVAWDVLDVVALWSRYFLLLGKRLLALVHSDDRGLGIDPVGARPVLWNRAEQRAHARERLADAREGHGAPCPRKDEDKDCGDACSGELQ